MSLFKTLVLMAGSVIFSRRLKAGMDLAFGTRSVYLLKDNCPEVEIITRSKGLQYTTGHFRL